MVAPTVMLPPNRRRRLLIEPLTSEGAEVYPTFLPRPLCGVGDHELELAACRAG
jgi:hypothetical protein